MTTKSRTVTSAKVRLTSGGRILLTDLRLEMGLAAGAEDEGTLFGGLSFVLLRGARFCKTQLLGGLGITLG